MTLNLIETSPGQWEHYDPCCTIDNGLGLIRARRRSLNTSFCRGQALWWFLILFLGSAG